MKIKNFFVLSLLALLWAGTSAYAAIGSNHTMYSNVTITPNGSGDVTITVTDGDNLSGFDMYVGELASKPNIADGTLMGGVSAADKPFDSDYRNNDEVKNVTINLNGGEGLKNVVGMGYVSHHVTGAVEININAGSHGNIIGGVQQPSGDNAQAANGASDKGYFANVYETNDITINMRGGNVAQIIGGNAGSSADVDNWLNKGWATENPSVVGGDIKISVSGGTIGTSAAADAIIATDFSHAVGGNVSIEISGETTVVNGNVVGGAKAAHSYVGGDSDVSITGGTITGDVYGGGILARAKGEEDAAPEVRGSSSVTMTGGVVDGSVYGAGKGIVVKGSSEVMLTSGTVKGNVYGGGEDSTIGEDVTVTIDGADVEGDVYGAGKNSSVAGISTVQLLAGNVGGTVSATGENSTAEKAIIKVGSDAQAYTGSVGDITGFDEMIVAAGSKITQTGGNAFATKEQSYTLSSVNLKEAVVTLGEGASVSVEDSITLNLTAAEPLGSGKYMLVDASGAEGVDLSNWTADTVTINGLDATFEDLVWGADNVLYYIIKRSDVANVMASNWGVFKSSQAFVRTLWGNRSNCAEIKPAVVADGKGGLVDASIGRTLAWGAVYGQSARISGIGADYSLWGGAVGAEHQFVSGRSVGIALGYDWGTVTPFNSGDIDQETVHAALYGRAATWHVGQKGAITLDWSAAYGNTTSETEVITGDWSQNDMQLDVRAAYHRCLTERMTGSLFGGLQYFAAEDTTVDGVGISSMQNLRVEIGAVVSYQATQKMAVYGEVSVYNDLMRHNPYAVVDGERLEGSNPGRTGGIITAGAVYQINDSWSLRGSYSFEAADDSVEHNVNVGAVYSF